MNSSWLVELEQIVFLFDLVSVLVYCFILIIVINKNHLKHEECMNASDQIFGNPELLLPLTQDVPELKSLGPFGSFILSSKLLLSMMSHLLLLNNPGSSLWQSFGQIGDGVNGQSSNALDLYLSGIKQFVELQGYHEAPSRPSGTARMANGELRSWILKTRIRCHNPSIVFNDPLFHNSMFLIK